ncbi:MAG: crossover junction endodeoxyribonuclease RuvC [Candidatus Pacebacteria bacterium]|nr:crossover junction endodeoxyribonuclease RuvC [Candidatus Paceibacterota bacterium]
MAKTILAIDPGTRHWGVSVFRGTEIMICMVRNLSAKDSTRNRVKETRRVFTAMIRNYAPDILVIEKPFSFWTAQSEYLNAIIREIKHLARKEKVQIFDYSPKTVKMSVCNDGNANKEAMAHAICLSYPDLKIYLNQNRKYKDKYWGHMFDSIGLGICCLMQITDNV